MYKWHDVDVYSDHIISHQFTSCAWNSSVFFPIACAFVCIAQKSPCDSMYKYLLKSFRLLIWT